jgi:copper chaperone CopZ
MKKNIAIKGMQCSHCAGLINIQLYSIAEVVDVTVNVQDQKAIVLLKADVDDEVFIKAVEIAGYSVEAIT